MRKRGRPGIAAIAIIGMVETVLAPAPPRASAAPSALEPGSKEDARQRRYQRAIDAAVAAYTRRDYPTAYKHFLEAHTTKPSARTQRGMGMAAFEMKEFVVAATHLFAALSQPIDPLPVDLRMQVDKLFKKTNVAVLRLFVEPPTAEVVADGQPVPADDLGKGSRDVFVLPGAHSLEMRAAGHQSQRSEVTVVSGEVRVLTVRLAEVAKQLEPETVRVDPKVDTSESKAETGMAAPTIHLKLLSEPKGLRFWIRDADLKSGREFLSLCQAPCEKTLDKREYTLALSETASEKEVLVGWPIEPTVTTDATVLGKVGKVIPGQRLYFYLGLFEFVLGSAMLTAAVVAHGNTTGKVVLGGVGAGLASLGGYWAVGHWPSTTDHTAEFTVQPRSP